MLFVTESVFLGVRVMKGNEISSQIRTANYLGVVVTLQEVKKSEVIPVIGRGGL
jgi:hypothetical protein